jgi:hypothetical protein
MVSKPQRGPFRCGPIKSPLKRRDFLKLALAGIASSCLNRGCEKKSATNPPEQEPEALYELTDGRTLYDDFDGNGGLQAYSNQNLAEAGKLSSVLWEAPDPGSEVVQSPVTQSLLTVVNEERQRVEYRLLERLSQEIKYVFDADGKMLQAVPHIPGRPYHGSKKLLWVGARNDRYETEAGPMVVEKGKVYGAAELERMGGRGWVLKLTNSELYSLYCFLTSRRGIEFADYRTFSADVLLPSASNCPGFYASLCYHTTIPEQDPGLSWVSDLGIRKYSSGEVLLFATCINRNTGYQYSMTLGQALLDTWYNLRMAVVTQRDDPALKSNEFRVEYYVNDELLASDVPEDSGLLLDPEKTGAGPHRFLRLCVTVPEGESMAFFDNVRAVYLNRIK